jgi:regulatory protein
MSILANSIDDLPHAEERPKGASRSTLRKRRDDFVGGLRLTLDDQQDNSRSRTRNGATKVSESKIDPDLLERWALHYLGRYASSAANLRRVLRRRLRRHAPEHMPEVSKLIDAIVSRYRESGLLDDAAYAAGRVQSLHRRGQSVKAIRARLAAKGVALADVADAVSGLRAEASEPDLSAACAFARRRRLGPFRRAAADRARELGAFARAGFSRRVAEAVLACSDIEAVEALARDGLD